MDLKVVDELLSTTRSVRKRLDFSRPVEPEIIEKCVELSLQSPTGSNTQGWRVVVVTDEEKRKALADLYRKGFAMYAEAGLAPPADDTLRGRQMPRVIDSATYLAEHLEEAPVHVLYCIEGRVEEAGVLAQASIYGSILPAAWSFMLAARARGLGSAWTSIHLFFEKEAADLLSIPPEFTQAVLLPVAYFTGETFKPAKRIPATELTYWNEWGKPRS
jgi:nitroreductase